MAAKLRSATFTWLEVLLMAFNATKLTADAALDANYDEKRVLQLLAARPSYMHCNWTRRDLVRQVESCSAEEHAYPHHSLPTDTQAKRAAMPHLRLARRIAPLRFSF